MSRVFGPKIAFCKRDTLRGERGESDQRTAFSAFITEDVVWFVAACRYGRNRPW